jgi:hypothetical protein
MDWEVLTKYVLPPILGGIAGLSAAFFNWGIEKRRQRLQSQRELVTDWRMNLIPMIAQPENKPMVWAGERQRKVISSPYYASLRPHLSHEAIAKIEDGRINIFVDRGHHTPDTPKNDWNYHFPLKIFVEEIARVEREWKLV